MVSSGVHHPVKNHGLIEGLITTFPRRSPRNQPRPAFGLSAFSKNLLNIKRLNRYSWRGRAVSDENRHGKGFPIATCSFLNVTIGLEIAKRHLLLIVHPLARFPKRSLKSQAVSNAFKTRDEST